MKKINNLEMQHINGGAIKWGAIAGIGGLASFIIGLIDGWMNPKRCN